MAKRQPKYFYCETWKMNYYFFIGWSAKLYSKYIQEEYGHTMDINGAAGNCLDIEKNDNSIQIQTIWVDDKKDLPAIVHESVHAACNTLRRRGWNPDFDNEEPLTYLIENIFRQATK